MPHLELKQSPNSSGVIGAALLMLPDQALDLGAAEVPAADRTRIEEDLLREFAEIGAEPRGQRYPKPHLSPLEDLLRQPRPQRVLEDLLSGSPGKLQIGRKCSGELHELVVEKRRARFH